MGCAPGGPHVASCGFHAPPSGTRVNQIKTIYIDPGSPWQNGCVESFHGRLRDECLNREQLWTLTEARVVVADFRQHRHSA